MTQIASALVRARGAISEVHRARGAGPLRLLTPRNAGNAGWIVTSSLGGGLVDGDDVALEVEVDRGATCVIATQASTKAYRGRSFQRLHANVADGAAAIIVPDPLVPFRDATIRQVTRIALAPTAQLVLCDIVTAGRIAHGERWACARLDTTLSITGLLHDRVVLDRAHGSIADRMRGVEALATCIVIGPKLELPAWDFDPQRAASPLGRGAIIRLAGNIADVIAESRALLAPACAQLGEDPWARKW